jgi:AcrR family transcriptional regulator
MVGAMSAVADGRRLRSLRTRDAVVDALLELYDEGVVRPGAALIAERAGVSQSSVFRQFQDLEDLVETAVAHQWQRIHAAYDAPPTDGTIDRRVAALARQRVRLYEAAGTAMRAGRIIAPDSPALRAAFDARRALLRDQIVSQFGAEIAAAPSADRRMLTDALDIACGLEQVEHLRVDRALTPRQAERVLAFTLRSILRGA